MYVGFFLENKELEFMDVGFFGIKNCVFFFKRKKIVSYTEPKLKATRDGKKNYTWNSWAKAGRNTRAEAKCSG